MSLSNAKIIAMLSFIFVLNNCSDEKKHVPGLPTFLNKNPFHWTSILSINSDGAISINHLFDVSISLPGLSINPDAHTEPSNYLKELVENVKNESTSSDFTYENEQKK